MPDKNIKVDGDFVEEKNIPRDHEAHTELHAAPLAVRDVVHVPVKVDIKQIKEKIPSLLVSIATNGIEELRDHDVAPDDGVHGPGNG